MVTHWPTGPSEGQSAKKCKRCGSNVSPRWAEATDRLACPNCNEKLRSIEAATRGGK